MVKLLTYRVGGGTRAGRLEDDRVVDLPYPDVGAALAAAASEARGLETLTRLAGAPRSIDGLDLAPVVPHPSKIFCVGLNYATHIAETGHEPPKHPTLFAKFACALLGPRDELVLSQVSERIDWEAELAVVIGRTVRNASRDQAKAAIAGYAVMNDVSMRDWQRRTTQWLQGKTFERTAPLGPHLVTLDDIPDPNDLGIRCSVDGVVMQEARTSDLIFGPVELIEYISRICTLVPGDLIATGTTGGVGDARDPKVYLRPGQTLRTEIDAVGHLVNTCVAEDSSSESQ